MFGFLTTERDRNDLRQKVEAQEELILGLLEEFKRMVDAEATRRAAYANLEAEVTDLIDKMANQLKKLRQRDYRAAKAAESAAEDAPEVDEAANGVTPSQHPKAALYRAARARGTLS